MRRIRIKPHHIALGIGVLFFLLLIASDTIASILSRHPVGDVLVVTHGGVIQVTLGSVVAPRQGSDGLFPFVIENCSLTALQRTGSRTVVTSVNDVCHLS